MRGSALLALIGFSLASCTGPRLSGSQLQGWYGVQLRDVRIVAQAPAERVRALARKLAVFDTTFAHLLKRRVAPDVPTAMYLVSDPNLVDAFGLGNGIDGWALSSLEGAFACVHLGSGSARTRLTLYHEYTHLLLARGRRSPLPRWYNEGLADYFSTLAFRDGALVVGAVPAERMAPLVTRGAMPLDRLFEGRPAVDGEDVLDFYATAWALSHYLMSTPDGRRELSRFSQQLSRGVPVDDARRIAFARPLDRLGEELSTHIGYLARGVAVEMVFDPRGIAIDEPPEPRLLGAAEVARELGTLALIAGEEARDLQLASALLEAGVAEDPSNARALAALARSSAGTDPSGAEATMAAALLASPDDPVVLLRAGQASLDEEALETAEIRFRSALSRDDRLASAWFGLGRVLSQSGRPGESLAAFERAREIAWSAQLDVEIARLHLAAGREQEARAWLWPVAQDPHGGSAAETARELLREAGLVPGSP